MSASTSQRRHLERALFRMIPMLLVLLTGAVCCADEPPGNPPSRKTENVILVTIDGLRWQELFTGAEKSLINSTFGGVKDEATVNAAFWRESPKERRQLLMPFFWSTVAKEGRLIGNPDDQSNAIVANEYRFSYPGYNEILAGIADPQLDSNAKRPNPNVTVLEWLHRQADFAGRVQVFASWDVFPFIINTERSGIPVNAGWQPLATGIDDPELRELDELSEEIPRYWHNARYDYFTYRGALACLKRDQPRLLYVAFDETDDWAHARRYDLYLDAARRTDRYIERLWNTAQRLPQYAGKTSLVLVTDHGRGDTRIDWKNHGKEVAGSERIWIAVLGPDTLPGSPGEGETVMQGQVAATVAWLLGRDFQQAIPAVAAPLPGVVGAKR